MKVPTLRGTYRCADAFVACTPQPNTAIEVAGPVMLFEVLSPSASSDDRITKLDEFQSIPSLVHHVLLEQDRKFDTAMLALPEIGVELPFAESYEGPQSAKLDSGSAY